MEDTATIATTRSFLALIEEDRVPSSRELLRALDRLAMAYHEAPEGEPADDDARPPRREYQERYASLAKRFSDYGYYAVSDPTEPVNEEGMVGDAIDDLADISADLEQVIWRFENLGPDDAHWHFRFLFEIHWGMHLRELSLYLHANALRASSED
jgi:hypothetical protein